MFSEITFSILRPLLTTFVVICLFVQLKASGWAHVTWSWHKRSQRLNKLAQRDAITVAGFPNSKVKVKNMSYCENSNKKLMFFDVANSSPKIKSTVFLTEIE